MSKWSLSARSCIGMSYLSLLLLLHTLSGIQYMYVLRWWFGCKGVVVSDLFLLIVIEKDVCMKVFLLESWAVQYAQHISWLYAYSCGQNLNRNGCAFNCELWICWASIFKKMQETKCSADEIRDIAQVCCNLLPPDWFLRHSTVHTGILLNCLGTQGVFHDQLSLWTCLNQVYVLVYWFQKMWGITVIRWFSVFQTEFEVKF